MSEDLDIEFPVKRTPTLVAKRPLTQSDLDGLGPRGSVSPRVQQFRDSHHRIARAYASGMRDQEVGFHTGYSQSRLSILKSDPAFQDLIERYREVGTEQALALADLMLANSIKAQTLINESLEAAQEAGQPLAVAELRPLIDLSADLADRTGYPKHNVNTSVNLTLGDRLESARKRLAAGPQLIEGVAQEPVNE